MVKFILEQAMKTEREREVKLHGGWVVSIMPWPLYSWEKDLVPIMQGAG
jgi:hypothetical protein